MSSPTYILDANVFIEAARRYYAFDIAPKFWESLISSRNIYSIDRIKDELMQRKPILPGVPMDGW